MNNILLRTLLLAASLAAATPALAQTAAKPEIERPVTTAQAVGQVHTARTIPEVCQRFEGRFTGNAADPYQVRVVQTAPHCQARARLIDPAQARPERGGGWIWYDSIRIPNAACPTQIAVLDVYRKPGTAQLPAADAQGRVRIYLDEAKANAQANAARARQVMPQFSVVIGIEGRCG